MITLSALIAPDKAWNSCVDSLELSKGDRFVEDVYKLLPRIDEGPVCDSY